MSNLTGITRLGAILVALMCLVLIEAPNASAQTSSCLPSGLKAKLNQIREKFGPVKIVSTHRPGARIAGSGKRSYHASCRAVDFHPPKGKYSEVVAWLKANHAGGVGTYSCGMHHIHIDNGPRVRFHHCVNAQGTPIGKGRSYASKSSKKRYSKKSTGGSYASSTSLRPTVADASSKKAKPFSITAYAHGS
jgi:hypothetical protein